MIEISLNGDRYHTAAQDLGQLLQETDFGPKVATAQNGQFIPTAMRAQTPLAAGDVIEVLAAMQGG